MAPAKMEGPKSDNDDINTKTTDDGLPPRKWLYDRILGKSKVGNSRPPHEMCWVPPPVGWCPSILEESAFCRLWGRIGVVKPENEKGRFWIVYIGFIANVIGFILTIYSCFAISLDENVLKASSFSSAGVTGPLLDKIGSSIRIELGLRGGLVEWPFIFEPFVVGFDELCDLPDDELETYFISKSDSDCNSCSEVSNSMVFSVIFSVITFIPSFSTNILRLYSNYDVNCQKGFSTLFATLTLILSINTLVKYNQTCFAAFYSGTVPLEGQIESMLEAVGNHSGQIVNSDQQDGPSLYANFQWNIGPGLVCLYLGTILKAIDIAANLAVPSPDITRDRKLQWEYEALEPAEEETDSNVHHDNDDGGEAQ